ncbi:hypothetical protein ACOMHN_023072 [Nucella lapillus]
MSAGGLIYNTHSFSEPFNKSAGIKTRTVTVGDSRFEFVMTGFGARPSAYELCAEQGGRLAVLNTVSSWDAVSRAGNFFTWPLGLQLADSSLPWM